MSTTQSHYSVLGLAPSATSDQIRRAYRTLAKRLHPDVSKDSDAQGKFAAVAAAYETLNDPDRRRAYDQQLLQQERAERPVDLRAHYSWRNVAGSQALDDDAMAATDLDELYDTFFGGPKAGKPGKAKGSNGRTPKGGPGKSRG